MSSDNYVSPWWEETDTDKILKAATRLYQDYVSKDRGRLSAINAYERIYTNREISGSSYLASYTAIFNRGGKKPSGVPLNLAKVIVDAVHARVTRQAIAVKFLTETHNFSKRKGARQMERFVDFQEHQGGGESCTHGSYLDACITGTGIMETDIHPKIDDVLLSRVSPADVFIDPAQAATTREPVDMFRRKLIPRTLLKAFYPDFKEEIQKAGDVSPVDPGKTRTITNSNDNSQIVEVVYGWRRPSYKGADDGRFVIFVNGTLLDSGNWEALDFPLSFVRWKDDPTVGFWGIGLCEELMGLHFDFNNILFQIYRAVELVPRPILFLPVGAKVKEGTIGNSDGLIVEFVDGNPRLELPMSVPTDMANLLMSIWGKALEVGRLAALSLPESTGGGFETGQALRDFNDIQSTELAPNFKEWQQFRVRVAEQLITGGKRLAERAKANGRTYKVVMSKDRYTIEEIEWNNISLNPREDSYVIQALPASSLSQTFAGKKADVIDLLNSQLIDQETALSLLDFPDLAEFFDAKSGGRRAIEKEIEKTLDDEERIPFDPNNNIRLGLKMYQEAISKAQAMDVPEQIIQLLRDNVEQIQKYIEEEQMATRNAASGMGPGLPGSPPALDINGLSPQANAEGQQQQ